MMDIAESGFRFRFAMMQKFSTDDLDITDVNTAWFDIDKLIFPLSIRNFKPGDRMSLLGMQGHQKIKKLFGDRKIPIDRRHCMPILVSGDEIIWVAGIRRSALAIPTSRTTQVLKVQILDNPCEIH